VDFPAINSGPTRLTVGAANIQTGEMRYFDSHATKLTGGQTILASVRQSYH
jgi:NTE family protein